MGRLEGVYVIQAEDGPVKIGHSTNVRRRMSTLQISSPVPLSLVAVLSGDRTTEKEMHARFAGSHKHGEWFDLDDAVIDELRGQSIDLHGGLDDGNLQINVVIPTDLMDALKRMADAGNRSFSAEIRTALKRHIESSEFRHVNGGLGDK
jgi:hypothetical protein